MLSLRSPAKVNLFLRILEKRSDGYHQLASLFHLIDLADTLTLSLSNEDQLICTDTSIGPNIVTKAMDLFRSKTGLKFHVSIDIEKHIPIQAGLGGGSSNAATALKGINQLLGFPVSNEQLQIWSLELGSDVPFFFSSGVAYCTGRGENIYDLPDYQLNKKIEIFKPDVGLSTQAVYKQVRLEECDRRDPEQLLESFLKGSPQFVNDLEPPAFRLMPSLKKIKREKRGMMSGSGTAFFRISDE